MSQKLPTITVITRSDEPGIITKNSIILLDGKPIIGLKDVSIELNAEDQTGVPTVKLSLIAHVNVIVEKKKEEKADEPAGNPES